MFGWNDVKILAAVLQVVRNTGVIMQELDDLKTSVNKLKTDLGTAIADASAKIDKLIAGQADPTVAASLAELKTNIDAMDAAVGAFDPGPATA